MNLEGTTRLRVLRGPNLWTRGPVLEATLPSDTASPQNLANRVLELQRQCGSKVSFADARENTIAVEFENETLARECLAAALRGEPDLAALRALADDILLGPNTRALADAASRRGIPVRRLGNGSVLILGHGAHQRRLEGARTDRTSAIGEAIGWEKPLAKELLRAVGLPTPEGRLVTDVDDALRAAKELGGLIVIKPESANHGRSVFVGLSGREEIAAAYESARNEGETTNVIVERLVPGAEHRVLVVDGHVAAATRGDALYITGDGTHTVSELVDEVNRDPRRSDDPDSPLYPVTLDPMTLATLAHQGYTPAAIPEPGTRVLVQRNGNLSTDVTGHVHAANESLCVLAAEVIGLDIAGIDLVVEDIGRPMTEQGGAFLEVNAMPGLMMHLRPGNSTPQPVDDIIVRALFPEASDGRIPIAALSGLPGLGGQLVDTLGRHSVFARFGNSSGMLLDPRLQAAIFDVPDLLVEGSGLPFDFCRLAVFDESPLTPARRVLLDSVADEGCVFLPRGTDWPPANRCDVVFYDNLANLSDSIARRLLAK